MTAAVIPEALADLRVPIDLLHSYVGNARVHDMELIRDSLRRYGQYRPIVVNRGSQTGRLNEILAGNGTWEGAKAEGWEEIAATYVDVNDDVAARIVAVDNRSNDLASYDDRLLVEFLSSMDDLAGTGWSDEDLTKLAQDLEEAQLRSDLGESDEGAASDEVEATHECPNCHYRWRYGSDGVVEV